MFRLALALGMTVAELGRRMSSRELAEWRAFDALEPLGEPRADYRAGVIAATIANVHRGKRTRAFEPKDFMPYMEKPAVDAKAQQANLAGDIKAFFKNYEAKRGGG
jgi:hypothetical protein|tara:strand:- start:8392 stop:8709 length:318 start_codon:yes stop_codon:yes gene_type:complete